MTLGIIHLSDIHVSSKDDLILQRHKHLSSAILSKLGYVNYIFIIITGDIAYSGSKEQYELALDFLGNIESEIKAKYENTPIQFILVPGNHDCDFSDNHTKELHEILVSRLKEEEEISDVVINECLKRQENFYLFAETLNDKYSYPEIFQKLKYEIGEKIVSFNLVNSAWMSTIHEKEGSIIIPSSFINVKDASCDLSISLWHHPTRWLSSENDKKFRKIIEKQSDLILLGHEHIAEQMEIIKKESCIRYFYGGALQDNLNKISQFNLIEVSLDSLNYFTYQYSWSDDDNRFSETSEEGGPLHLNFSSLYINLDDNFKQELNDFGMPIIHPHCENVRLSDLFICPDINVITLEDTHKEVKSSNVFEYLKDNGDFLVFGEESSGKSAISKMFYSYIFKNGYYPILLDGNQLLPSTLKYDSLLKLFSKKAQDQYGSDNVEKFMQLPLEKRVVIIDNFQLCKLNNFSKKKLFDNLKLICKKLVFFLSGTYHTQFLEEREIYSFFNICQIKEFGHKLRFELIKKWNYLGQECVLEENQLVTKSYGIEKMINIIIGKKYVPTYPSYIILLLQQSSQAKLKESTSTYGHLYDFLIKEALLKGGFLAKEIDRIYTFLSMLAFYFYKSNVQQVNRSQLTEQLNNYNTAYDMDLGTETIDKLVYSKVLKFNSEEFSFRYPFYYYFFCAYFINANFDKGVKEEAITLLKKLHLNDYSNILIFLCHFNKSPYLFELISQKAKSIFSEVELYNIDDHNNFIHKIQKQIEFCVPNMLPSEDITKNKNESLEKQDQNEQKFADRDAVELDDTDPNMKEIVLLSSAFRTIEVIGHIIKNYAGSLDRDTKIILLKDCYELGMRSLKFQMDMLQDMIEALVEMATEQSEKSRTKISAQKIIDRTYKLFFDLCFLFAYGQIRVVSQAVASEDLIKTYDRLLANEYNSSLALVIQNAKLNDLRRLEPSSLIKLADSFKDINQFCYNLVKQMLYDYLYFNKCDIFTKQRLCAKLGFSHDSHLNFLSSSENKVLLPL